MAPDDLVLVTSEPLLDELEEEIDYQRRALRAPDHELATRSRRIVAGISWQILPPGAPGDPVAELLRVGAASNGILVTEDPRIAHESENGARPQMRQDKAGRPVHVMLLWPFICWRVNKLPFDLADAPEDLLSIALRSASTRPTA